LMREETDVMKFLRGQSTARQGGNERARTRDNFYPKAFSESGAHDPMAGIADARNAGVRHQSDLFTAPESLEDFLGAPRFIELKIADERFGDPEMLQQLTGPARVFRSDDIAFPQGAQRSKSDIFEIANRRCHQVKSGRG